MSVKLTFTRNEQKIIIPIFAGKINNFYYNNQNIPYFSKDYNDSVTLYENTYDYTSVIEKPSIDDLPSGGVVYSYACEEIPNLTLNLGYYPYSTGVVGASNNRGYSINIAISVGSTNQGTIGTGYPSPIPANTGTNSSQFAIRFLCYDQSNKQIFIVNSFNTVIKQVERDIGKEYGVWTTISTERQTLSKGTYNILTNTYDYNGKPAQNERYTQDDIGGTIHISLSTGDITRSNNGNNVLYNTIFSKIKPPSYPDGTDDDDGDDDGQPFPDDPIPGDEDTDSDPIPIPPSPVIDVTNTGFVVIYNPTALEVAQLARFMWSGEFVDLIKKMFAEPFAALISLKILYCNVTAGAKQTVWLGNVETDVTMGKVTKQFTDVDMGSITINEFYGSFADYSPYTKIQIFLPFIGYKDLNVDEVMNSVLSLTYRIDVYTGACVAFLKVTKAIKSTNLNSVLYQFDGNCAMEIPFTSNDNSRYVAAILQAATSSALSLANSSAVQMPQQDMFSKEQGKPSLTLGSLAPVANGMLDIISAKPNVQRSGSLAGAVASMGIKQPYIIIHRPISHIPSDYAHFLGIPLNLTYQLSQMSGYTICSQVFFSSSIATDIEIDMVTEMLRSGVIL